MATEHMKLQVGMPKSPPSEEVLAALKNAVSTAGAETVYWFWMTLGGDAPHLGLAVSPSDDSVVVRVGRAVDAYFKRFSPDGVVFDILRLGDKNVDPTILAKGRLLYRSSSAGPDGQ